MTVRIGMITPSSNTAVEPVTYGLLRSIPSVSAHFARIGVTKIELGAESDTQFDGTAMGDAAALLADAKVDVLAWNGTSGSWMGIQRDRDLCRTLEGRTGICSTTSTLAILDACAAFGITTIALVTPYTADVVDAITREYAKEGIEVVGGAHADLTDNHSFATIEQPAITQMVRSAAVSKPQAVVILCTNMFGADQVAMLEGELQIPVIDSVAATLWACLRASGTDVRIDHEGALLQTGTMRAGIQDRVDALLAATQADRVTLRIDHRLAEAGPSTTTVNVAAAEACAPGIRSIRHDSSLPQRALETVVWIDQHRKLLVQNNFAVPPHPPTALIDVYGVRAQMLSPIENRGCMTGWVSVHSVRERTWAGADIDAITCATQDLSIFITPQEQDTAHG